MPKFKIGDKVASFTLPGVDDRHHSLDDHADKKAVAIIFTCNHCPYARAWEDRLVQMQSDYANKAVQFLAINANDAAQFPEDSFGKMKERARAKRYTFPYLHDETQEVARAFGAKHTPEVFLIDNSRALRYHGTVDDNHEDPLAVEFHYLRDAIDAVLAGKAPKITQTDPVGCTIKWK
jgi:peroxiredoxin